MPPGYVDEEKRRRIVEYVKPLAAGLDGAANYGDIQRVAAAARRIAGGREDVDSDLLFLLAVFSGQEKWVSRMGHKSRTEIFLASLGVSENMVRSLFGGLARFENPRTPEEEIVHDAVRLEDMGAYGIARALVEGHHERMDLLEMADSIEQASRVPLHTEAGRRLGEQRREAMRDFAERLRREYEEFGG